MFSLIASLCSYCIIITEDSPSACSVFIYNVSGVSKAALQAQDQRRFSLSPDPQHVPCGCCSPITPPAPQPSTSTRQQGSKNQTSGLLSWASHNWPKVTLCIYAQLKNLHTFKLLSTRYVVTQNIHWPLAECILIEVITHSAPAARTPTWYVWK